MAIRWNFYKLRVLFKKVKYFKIIDSFLSFRQYADRLYQYNQPEWSCKYTGKGQLTFAEAFSSEEKVRKTLDSFPEAWKGPLLAFIQHSTASLDQICSQFLDFIKGNYIPGEDIKINFNGKR